MKEDYTLRDVWLVYHQRQVQRLTATKKLSSDKTERAKLQKEIMRQRRVIQSLTGPG